MKGTAGIVIVTMAIKGCMHCSLGHRVRHGLALLNANLGGDKSRPVKLDGIRTVVV